MRSRLLAIAAAIGVALSLLVPTTSTAQIPASVSAPSSVQHGATVKGYTNGTVTTTGAFPEQRYRFASTSWCVWGAIESPLYPLATATSKWSAASAAVSITSEFGPHLTYNGCQNYDRNREIYVYYTNMPSEAACWLVYADWDNQGYTTIAQATINLRDGCRYPSQNLTTAANFRAHVLGMAIGTASGLVQLPSNVRVMGYGDDAYRNVPYANSYDGQQMTCRYSTAC